MINICFFIGSFRIGGAQNLVLQIINNLDREKYKVFVVAFSKKDALYEKYIKQGIEVNIFPKRSLVAIIKYAIFLRKNKIHCLHIHLVGSFMFALTIAKIVNIKYIIIHWHNVYRYNKYNFHNIRDLYSIIRLWFLMRYSAKLSNKIIAISNIVKKSNCNRFKINKDKVSVVYNAIDLSKIPQKNKPSNKKSFIIGSIGKISPQKGFDTLIRAIKIVNNKYPNCILEIIGSFNEKSNRSYSKELVSLVKELRLQNSVYFLDSMSYDKVYKRLFEWSIFSLASKWEGFGLVLIEAMASEIPVIANDVDAIPEIIENGKTGLIFKKNDVNDLADKIIYLYNNRKLQKELILNAKKEVEQKFTIDIMVKKLDYYYTKSYKD